MSTQTRLAPFIAAMGAELKGLHDADRLIAAVPPTNYYVNGSTGSNSNNGLSSGAAFATINKAISMLPSIMLGPCTINVADGTYAESIKIAGILNTRDSFLRIIGNTGSPNNVITTGVTTAYHDDSWFGNTGALISGRVFVELSGMQIKCTNGGESLIAIRRGAWVILDRCNGTTVSGTVQDGVSVSDDGSFCEIQGSCTYSGFTRFGIDFTHNGEGTYSVTGTLTFTGPGGTNPTAIGIHCFSGGAFITYVASTNITITGCQFAIQMGLHGRFQHQGNTSTLTFTNSSIPANSAIVQTTDFATFSMKGAITATNATYRFWANSHSYIEHSNNGGAAGTRTLTTVGGDNLSQFSSLLVDSTQFEGPLPAMTHFVNSGAGNFDTAIVQNRLYYSAIFIPHPAPINGMIVRCGSVIGSNHRMCLIDSAGNVLKSTPSTAQSAPYAEQEVAFTGGAINVNAGIYYIGVIVNNTTGKFITQNPMGMAAFSDPGSFTIPATVGVPATSQDAGDIPFLATY